MALHAGIMLLICNAQEIKIGAVLQSIQAATARRTAVWPFFPQRAESEYGCLSRPVGRRYHASIGAASEDSARE